MDTVADKLREARALIERGWTRHNIRKGSRVCSLGALNEALTGDAEVWPHYAKGALHDEALVLLYRATGDDCLGEWNDRQPSKKPVLAAFDKAIELAEAGQ